MASNPVVKLKRGVYSSLDTYPTIDGQLYFATGADSVLSASAAANDTSGYNLFILDMENGNSVERKKLDAYRAIFAQQADIATSAGKWSTARSFKISDGTNTGTLTSVDGSAQAGYTLNLPSTIKASFEGSLTGTADKAKILVTSAGIAYDVGDTNLPVYFKNGIPVAVDELNIPSVSAGKWTNARVFKIQDNDGTNTEANGVSVDGSTGPYILKLPATIKATLTGRASSAEKLVNVNGNTVTDISVGGTATPVYFANGVPVAVGTSLDVDITGNADTATTASRLVSGSVGADGTPVYFSDGRPAAVTELDATKLKGLIPDSCFPAKVLERMTIVTTQAAMIALTSSTIQAGDTVRVADDDYMYYVVDSSTDVSAVDGAVTGTNFKFIPYSAGSAAEASHAATASALTSNRTFSITGGATAAAVNFNGSGNVVLNVTDLDVSKASAGTLDIGRGGTGKTSWTQYGLVYADTSASLSQVGVGTTGQVLVSNGSTGAPAWVTANDATDGLVVLSASKLTNQRSINGTNFDGTSNITTAQWGTARDITIQDYDNSNRQTVTGINGSQNFSLKLPATIKATLVGNADTATEAETLTKDLTIRYRNVANLVTDAVAYGHSHTDDVTYTIEPDKLFLKYSTTFQGALSAGTWQALTFDNGLTTGSYIVQIKTAANTNKFNNEYFTGVMSYTSETGAGTDSDEVLLHAAGKNLNGYHIYLRTRRANNGALVIEFQSDVALTNNASDLLTFTFRRMI